MPIVSRTQIYGSFARLCTKPKVVICPMLTACFFYPFLCIDTSVCVTGDLYYSTKRMVLEKRFHNK